MEITSLIPDSSESSLKTEHLRLCSKIMSAQGGIAPLYLTLVRFPESFAT